MSLEAKNGSFDHKHETLIIASQGDPRKYIELAANNAAASYYFARTLEKKSDSGSKIISERLDCLASEYITLARNSANKNNISENVITELINRRFEAIVEGVKRLMQDLE